MDTYAANIGHWISWWACADPRREAIIFEDQRVTYAELNEQVNRMANYLRGHFGIRLGDRIAFCMENRIEVMVLVLACGKIGAIVVPLSIWLTGDSLKYYVDDCKPRLVFCSSRKSNELCSEHESKNNCCIDEIICIDSAKFQNTLSNYSCEEPDEQSTWENDFAIMYTSGSTGVSKGAVITQYGLRTTAYQQVISLAYGSDERQLLALPLCFAGALIGLVMPILHVGGAIILEEKFEPERYLKLINQEHATRLNGVPTMFQRLSESPNFDAADFSCVRQLGVGGAHVPDSLIERYSQKGVMLLLEYGITEASSANMYQPASLRERKGAYIPFMWNPVKVVSESGEPIKPGEAGELLIGGSAVMRGYWGRPEATAEAIKDGWLYTGDLCTVDKDGFIYIVGRKKDIIISGGLNVSSTEVENALYNYPGIRDVAVIGLPHMDWGEAVTAFITFKDGQETPIEELIAYCHQSLDSYKVPKAIIYIEKMPRNNNGKIQKFVLRQQYENYFDGEN